MFIDTEKIILREMTLALDCLISKRSLFAEYFSLKVLNINTFRTSNKISRKQNSIKQEK